MYGQESHGRLITDTAFVFFSIKPNLKTSYIKDGGCSSASKALAQCGQSPGFYPKHIQTEHSGVHPISQPSGGEGRRIEKIRSRSAL